MEPTIKTNDQLEEALKTITFKNTVLDFNWRFCYRQCVIDMAPHPDDKPIDGRRYGDELRKSAWLVWVSFERPDTLTGEVGRGRGRDEIIWHGSTISSVIKTCWVLVDLMVKHELMEGFRFQDARIFNPHHSVLDLAKVEELHDRRMEVAK
jgi:hypothetical protein